jgi:hypothetical protein
MHNDGQQSAYSSTCQNNSERSDCENPITMKGARRYFVPIKSAVESQTASFLFLTFYSIWISSFARRSRIPSRCSASHVKKLQSRTPHRLWESSEHSGFARKRKAGSWTRMFLRLVVWMGRPVARWPSAFSRGERWLWWPNPQLK